MMKIALFVFMGVCLWGCSQTREYQKDIQVENLDHAKIDTGQVLFSENFHDLKQWSTLELPNVSKQSSYTIEVDGEQNRLKVSSDASASAIVHQIKFDVYKYPKLQWQWMVNGIYRKGDAKKRSGDDYPLRVFVIFQRDEHESSFFDRLAEIVDSRASVDSSLNYAWGNKLYKEDVLTSPYTEKAKMIFLQKGEANTHRWMSEEVNIVEDYRKAFGKNPPRIASIAIMSDSDDTGEKGTGYVKHIKVSSEISKEDRT